MVLGTNGLQNRPQIVLKPRSKTFGFARWIRPQQNTSQSHQSQFEHVLSTGSHRGVNTDGGRHADPLGSFTNNPRPQPSIESNSRSSPSAAAFAAAQVHAFGTLHLEGLVSSIREFEGMGVWKVEFWVRLSFK